MKKNKGFTLVELIVYSGIVAVGFVAIIYFLLNIVNISVKAKSTLEVQYNARFATERISHEIRGATGINVAQSVFGSNPGVLSLEMADPLKNPTIFDVSENRLRIKQGSNPVYELTSDEVKVANLIFTNLSQTKTPENIKINLTIERVNPENNPDWQASEGLETAVAVRRD